MIPASGGGVKRGAPSVEPIVEPIVEPVLLVVEPGLNTPLHQTIAAIVRRPKVFPRIVYLIRAQRSQLLLLLGCQDVDSGNLLAISRIRVVE